MRSYGGAGSFPASLVLLLSLSTPCLSGHQAPRGAANPTSGPEVVTLGDGPWLKNQPPACCQLWL